MRVYKGVRLGSTRAVTVDETPLPRLTRHDDWDWSNDLGREKLAAHLFLDLFHEYPKAQVAGLADTFAYRVAPAYGRYLAEYLTPETATWAIEDQQLVNWGNDFLSDAHSTAFHIRYGKDMPCVAAFSIWCSLVESLIVSGWNDADLITETALVGLKDAWLVDMYMQGYSFERVAFLYACSKLKDTP